MSNELTDNSSKSAFISLRILAVLAFALPFMAIFCGMFFYGMGFWELKSISESATTNNTINPILPFVLGAMSIFFFGYRGYDVWDRVYTRIMAIGAVGVAAQMCLSPTYNEMLPAIGVLGLSPKVSNIIHCVSAGLLFTAMNLWIMLRFTKHNVFEEITNEKKWRNLVYRICSVTGLISTVIFLIVAFTAKLHLPITMVVEILMLVPCSIAIFVKSGALLKDK